MKKIVVIGAFDCLNRKQVNLIKEALKLSIGKELIVLLYDDYEHFLDYGYFPCQDHKQRLDNLSYFIKPDQIMKTPLGIFLKRFDPKDCLFVHYVDDKDFVGRDVLKEYGVSIKFIKPWKMK